MKTYGTLIRTNGGWLLRADPHVMIRLKRIFPKASTHDRGALRLRDTTETAADIRWVLGRWPMDMGDDVAEHLFDRAAEFDTTQEKILSILDGKVPHLDLVDLALPLRSYQEEACAIVHHTGRLLLVDDLGLGKSASGIGVLRAEGSLPALVVTLTHLPTQWRDEVAKFLPGLKCHVVKKGTPYDITTDGGDPDVLIMNYAKLNGWRYHLAGKIRTVIFDEMQELRRDQSEKYRAATEITWAARYKMGLTATPIYNYGGEIYNLCEILDPGALGSREEFNREWGTGSSAKIAVNDPVALGSHLREIGLMLRRTRADVKRELPEVQRLTYPVDLDSDTLADAAAGAEKLARMILDRAGTTQEIWQASGDFDWRLRQATGVAKARHVADFVRLLLDTDEPIVLFGWHRDVYDIWRERLADFRPAWYTGSESPNQKDESKRRFLAGETNLLVMSLRSGAGLEGLQERAHVCVFGELDWSPGVHDQGIGRLHRDGQDEPVVAYYLVAEEGSDPAVAEVLGLKRPQADGIVDLGRELLAPVTQIDRVRMLAQSFLETRKDGG